jgi:aryl-alcohol dehydrogenase-like predicted oxidoreductase
MTAPNSACVQNAYHLIPGTSSLQHLRENLATATVHLDVEAIR